MSYRGGECRLYMSITLALETMCKFINAIESLDGHLVTSSDTKMSSATRNT
eukprot:m.401773 g.401773  ORF g.401773 m.401773 type:complete len:51 (-) comp16785_c1_seq58:4607-4759(-)